MARNAKKAGLTSRSHLIHFTVQGTWSDPYLLGGAIRAGSDVPRFAALTSVLLKNQSLQNST